MLSQNFSKRIVALSIFFLLAICSRPLVRAGQPIIWETGSRAELLKGESHGVSITDTGVLMLAPRFTQLFNTDQPYIWSSAVDNQGNIYLGTGHDGRIYRVSSDGHGALLYDAAELDVTALAIGRDGALYAGTSPDGKVYRISSDGHAEVYFDPHEKYVWALAFFPDGSLAVGTGDKGKLYRVRAAGAKPETALLINTNQTHVISLAVTAQGDLIAGTDPGGLVLRISPDGKAFGLFDAQLREIHALTVAPDGSVYALALGDAAATTRSQAPSAQPSESPATATSVTITPADESGAAMQQPQPPGRSRNDTSNARSAVFRILPDGGVDTVWSSNTVTAFAIASAPRAGSVLIGTADKGRIYSVTADGRDTLLLQSTEGQISSFVTRNGEVFAASSNQGKLFRFGAESVTEGTYESPVRDARLVASWGRIWWRGEGTIDLQTRSGNGERPDTTWSDWSAPYRAAAGNQVSSPRARFIQWRTTLRSSVGRSGDRSQTWMEDVSLAYMQRNVAPEVLSITVLPIGVGLQAMPQAPTDPNIESSGLDPSLFGVVAQIPPRRVYQRGARSIQWQAEDRNGDTLEYSVYYRALTEQTFRLLKDKLRDNFFTIDGATLADGRYIIKVVASDAPDNPAGKALTGERLSEPLDIDNTPPLVRRVGEPEIKPDGIRVIFDVEDATGRIKRADLSIDGSAWNPIFPDDGIADSSRERYTIELPITTPGEHTISLRAFDTSANIGSVNVTVRR
jgi:WD40 repeat protein